MRGHIKIPDSLIIPGDRYLLVMTVEVAVKGAKSPHMNERRRWLVWGEMLMGRRWYWEGLVLTSFHHYPLCSLRSCSSAYPWRLSPSLRWHLSHFHQ